MSGDGGKRPFGDLRDKLRSVQQQAAVMAASSWNSLSDSSPSPTNYFPTLLSPSKHPPAGVFSGGFGGKQVNKCDFGSNLLSKWQEAWKNIHEANEDNFAAAKAVERMAMEIHMDVERQQKALDSFNDFLVNLPVLQNEVHNLTAKIGSLCEDFDICEAGLFELKITGEILELQNRMDLQRTALQQHRERRKRDLEIERRDAALNHECLVKEHNLRLQQKLRDRQMAFEMDFNQDLTALREREEREGPLLKLMEDENVVDENDSKIVDENDSKIDDENDSKIVDENDSKIVDENDLKIDDENEGVPVACVRKEVDPGECTNQETTD